MQRRIEAVVGSTVGAALLGLAWAGAIAIRLRWPKDKEERDLWEREGHRPYTAEFMLGGGKFIPVSLNTGPLQFVAPYLAAGGALHDLTIQRAKAQAKLDEDALKRGFRLVKSDRWVSVT